MIRSVPIPKLAVFEKLSLKNHGCTKIMREQERHVISFTDFEKYEQNLERISLFYLHFTKNAYFRILQVILNAVIS